jgi:glutamyl-tRNA synthetase
MEVVTRIAPSPTGALHIGLARTALYNWAFARHHGGRILLRFEDTDQARSTPESEREILEGFEWLGIDFDPIPGFTGIPRQSERLPRYREALASLLASGHAYRCTCTPAELEAMRTRARAAGDRPGYDGRCRTRRIGADSREPFCVRLAIRADGPTRWTDLIAGPSGEDVSQLDDWVLARSDGTPVYHFAVVVDDRDMGVTHVIRGREHLTSTPRQLLLYDALGWTPPAFAHVPLLVEADGKKLSKRREAVSVQSYRERGFVPEALVNWVARLGWGHGDVEVFGKDELARLFRLEDVGTSPSQVHDDKLLWLNQHYLKSLPREVLLRHLQPFLDREAGRPVAVDASLARLLDLLRERSRTLEEMARLARFVLVPEIEIDAKAARQHLGAAALAPLTDLASELRALRSWDEDALRSAFERAIARHGLELGKLAQPVRVAVTGRSFSPGIFETLAVLGRDRTLSRLDSAIARIKAQAA